jgi:hypothetical protein
MTPMALVPLAPLRQAVAAVEAERPELATRIPAALLVLATHTLTPCAYTTGWWVGADGSGKFPEPSGGTDHADLVIHLEGYDCCSCSGYRRRGRCPHIVALALWERLQDAPYARQDGRTTAAPAQ